MAEQEVLQVDRHDPRIMRPLQRGPIYRKFGEIGIRIAEADEVVPTDLADGTHETSNTAHRGEAVITNPGGERYVWTQKTLRERHPELAESLQPGESTSVPAKGQIRAIRNPYGRKVAITASWGEQQTGDADARFAATYTPSTRKTSKDAYIVAGQPFKQTYEAVNPVRRFVERHFGR